MTERRCLRCGKFVGPRKRYCPSCYHIRHNEWQLRYLREHRKGCPRYCLICGVLLEKERKYCPTCFPIHRKEYEKRRASELWKKERPPKSTRWDYKCIHCGKPLSRRREWGGFYGGIPRFCSKKCERTYQRHIDRGDVEPVLKDPRLAKLLGIDYQRISRTVQDRREKE
ncbi:MAG: hypothetical protein ABR879_06420 [Methanomassiliicoccales archaeon]|jgi:RNA polymerase subunit RPABC4/transcription elongation factor Spt4